MTSFIVFGLVFDHVRRHQGVDHAGADGVDGDAERRVSIVARLASPIDAALGCEESGRASRADEPPMEEESTKASVPGVCICRSSCPCRSRCAHVDRRHVVEASANTSARSSEMMMPALLNVCRTDDR